ncbi:MAG: ECF-type sigma factor [Gemmatimonadales bacterium]
MADPELDVGEVTRLLQSAYQGEADALKRLLPLVYDDLRRLARRQLGYEYAERTLDPGPPPPVSVAIHVR